MAPNLQQGLTQADRLSQLGADQLVAGDAEGAIRAFAEAIASDPEGIEARHGLVRALCDAGRLDAAVVAAHELTQLTPEDPLAFTSLSIALQGAGKISEAESAAGRARILEWKQQLKELAALDSQKQDPPE